MKVRNTWDLENRLDRSLGPRKRELTEHRFATERAGSVYRASVLRRAGVVLMYAHWEGFVKEASGLYLSLVASEAPPVAQLSRNFQAIALRGTLLRLGSTRKVPTHIELLESIAVAMRSTQPARMPTKGIIPGRSNVSASAFDEILETLGLDSRPYDFEKRRLIERLVRLRHKIAHGARVPVERSTYDELHEHLIRTLDKFKEQIVYAALDRRFLATPRMP